MTWSEGNKWKGSVIIPLWQTVEFKCVLKKNNDGEFWQRCNWGMSEISEISNLTTTRVPRDHFGYFQGGKLAS
eukprot:9469672-Pyramimonas_sp.AAC.1